MSLTPITKHNEPLSSADNGIDTWPSLQYHSSTSLSDFPPMMGSCGNPSLYLGSCWKSTAWWWLIVDDWQSSQSFMIIHSRVCNGHVWLYLGCCDHLLTSPIDMHLYGEFSLQSTMHYYPWIVNNESKTCYTIPLITANKNDWPFRTQSTTITAHTSSFWPSS